MGEMSYVKHTRALTKMGSVTSPKPSNINLNLNNTNFLGLGQTSNTAAKTSFLGNKSMQTNFSTNTELHIPSNVSYLSQKPLLFARSLRDNIIMDMGEDTEKLEYALKYSRLCDDLENMPSKLETHIGESGGLLSGGQRVRLALARC